MRNSYIVKVMAEELNLMFWDFRCYFMHGGGNSITFDLNFFKLAKKSEIVFGDERVSHLSLPLFTFHDLALNKHLITNTAEERKFKEIVMRFFFLRKELAKVKKGEIKFDFHLYLTLIVEAGRSYGRIEELEVIKREVVWNLSTDTKNRISGRAYPSLGYEFQTALKTVRTFARPKRRGRDEFTNWLISVFNDFYKARGRYPRNKEVETLLEQAQGRGFIHSYDDEIEWGERGRTKATTLPNRLVEVRKILQQKKSR